MIRRRSRRGWWALGGALALLALVGACTRSVPGPDREARLADLEPEARLLYAQLEQEHRLHRDAVALDLGSRLLASYPAHPYAAEATAMMIDSALRLPDLSRAHDLVRGAPPAFLQDDRLAAAAGRAVAALVDAGRPAEALSALAALASGQPDPPRREDLVRRAPPLLAALSDEEILSLEPRLAASPLAAALQDERQRRRQAAFARAPADSAADLGVLVPLTGRYARYGNALLAGVHAAAATVPAPQGRAWRIRHEDTEGDVVTAALAARRLVEQEGCRVLLGALLSNSTATAALVADRLDVPLISPTATHARLDLLGSRIWQTNRTGAVEVEIMARLACTVLLKERFAIVRSDAPEAEALAGAFAAAVARHGGQVVHEETYESSEADFRALADRLRRSRPEAVFVQAGVDQMILLGPQLDFYRVGALVLGTSDWNSSRLLQRAGSAMQRALFPAGDILYPAAWTTDFMERWPGDRNDEEATGIARNAYLATRLILPAVAAADTGAAVALDERLRTLLAGRSVDLETAEAFSGAVRMIEGDRFVPFPGHLYAEALQRQAAADTARTEPLEGDDAPPAHDAPSEVTPRSE